MNINDYDAIADLYDLYLLLTFDIDFFVDQAKKVSGEVLELMSGTGRVSVPLLEAGVKLTCVDSSARSNAILQKKLTEKRLKADVRTMDVCKLSVGRQFSLVIIPFHSFAHIVSLDDQRAALDRIRRHLQPGGTFICTLLNPKPRREVITGHLRLLGEFPVPASDGRLLLWTVEDYADDEKRIVEAHQFYEEYDANGVLARKRLLALKFRLSSREEFESLAHAAGFRVKALYGDYSRADFDPEQSAFMIWILEKSGSAT